MRVISGTAKGTKLNSIDSLSTRPTLDRVKEPLFSIIQSYIPESNVLDLFAGSGALGIETLSRNATHCVFCDKSFESVKMIRENLQKTKLEDKATIFIGDYKKCLQSLESKFDIIFIDPPYKLNIAVDAIKLVLENKLLTKDGIIILETDEEKRDIKQLESINIEVYDVRKYGRVRLIFLRERG